MRRATATDAKAVFGILREAGAQLRARGIDQWPEDLFSEAGVLRSLSEHETFLAYLGAEPDPEPVGTLRIQWSDPQIWGSDSDLHAAVYIHRLAVRPEQAGRGIGRAMLAWAERYAIAKGRSRLRLDCWAGNARLRRYYEDAGFHFINETVEATWSVARFERVIK